MHAFTHRQDVAYFVMLIVSIIIIIVVITTRRHHRHCRHRFHRQQQLHVPSTSSCCTPVKKPQLAQGIHHWRADNGTSRFSCPLGGCPAPPSSTSRRLSCPAQLYLWEVVLPRRTVPLGGCPTPPSCTSRRLSYPAQLYL